MQVRRSRNHSTYIVFFISDLPILGLYQHHHRGEYLALDGYQLAKRSTQRNQNRTGKELQPGEVFGQSDLAVVGDPYSLYHYAVN